MGTHWNRDTQVQGHISIGLGFSTGWDTSEHGDIQGHLGLGLGFSTGTHQNRETHRHRDT